MSEEQSESPVLAETGNVAHPKRVQVRLETAKALSDAGFGDVLILAHESVREVFTPKRREIMEVLATEDVTSVRDLADRLDRNPGNISRELDVLVRNNVVGYNEEGKVKRPTLEYETVIGEPFITSEPSLFEERSDKSGR
jgi:predicted transcriptional regulator